MKKLLLNLIFLLVLGKSFAQDSIAHLDTIRIIKFSPDNSIIVTSGDDQMVRVWDVAKGRMKTAIKHGYDVKNIFIDPAGNLMLTGYDTYHCLWNIEEEKPLKCFPYMNLLGFTPEGKEIIFVEYGNDGRKFATLGLISLDSYEQRILPHKIYTHADIGRIYFFNHQKSFLVSDDMNILSYETDDVAIKEKYPVKADAGMVAISSDRRFYAGSGENRTYELQKNKKPVELKEPLKSDSKSYLWFTDDSRNLVSVFQKEITVFDADSGNVVKRFYGIGLLNVPSSDLKYLAVSPDGKKLSLKDLQTGELIFSYIAEDLESRTGYQNYLKGIKSFKEEDYLKAIDYLTKSAGKVKDDKVYLFRGRAYYLNGKFQKAIDDFLKDELIQPGRASYDLTRAYAASGNTSGAIEHLQRNLNSKYRKRWTYIQNDSCFSLISQDTTWQNFVQKQNISNAEKYAAASEERIKREDYRGAKKLLGQCIQMDPRNPDWYSLSGQVNLELGHYGDAVKDYKRELHLAPERVKDVYRNIAKVYARKGDLNRASMLLQEIIRKDSAEFSLLLDVAEIEYQRYDTKEALKAIDAYLSVLPDDDEAYYIKANIMEGEEGRRYIEKAISLCKASNKEVPQKYYDLRKAFL